MLPRFIIPTSMLPCQLYAGGRSGSFHVRCKQWGLFTGLFTWLVAGRLETCGHTSSKKQKREHMEYQESLTSCHLPGAAPGTVADVSDPGRSVYPLGDWLFLLPPAAAADQLSADHEDAVTAVTGSPHMGGPSKYFVHVYARMLLQCPGPRLSVLSVASQAWLLRVLLLLTSEGC